MTKPSSSPTLPCPNCQTTVTMSAAFPYRPFCSERCKLIDLGEWAAENHAIPGSPIPVFPDKQDNVNDV